MKMDKILNRKGNGLDVETYKELPCCVICKSTSFTRVFKKSVKREQLLWHKDRKDRKVKVVYGTGWKLQYDNQLPTELQVGQNYYINKNEFHRLHKGNSELKLEIKEYE